MRTKKKPLVQERHNQRQILSQATVMTPQVTGIGYALREVYAVDGADAAMRMFRETLKKLENL